MAKHSSHILEMARKGAEHRYEELKTEIAHLVKAFPHVAQKASKNIRKTASAGIAALEAEAPKVRRRVRKLSASARKAVSDRMTKYWAARRADRARASGDSTSLSRPLRTARKRKRATTKK
jgi:hypothetical protein